MLKNISVLVLFAGLVAAIWICRTPAPYSIVAAKERMATLRQRAHDAGYHVLHADTPLFLEFYVSRQPIRHEILSKADAELWDGVIWVSHFSKDVRIVGARQWGNVIAMGDAVLLDEFEDACRPQE